MTKLSVNVNKVATLRNARGGHLPNLLRVALDIQSYGVQGITVHPRPDERHIRYRDVYDIKENISVELNVEGYPSESFIRLIEDVRPAQCTLVPDPPDVITSNAGWKVKRNKELLCRVISKIKRLGVRVSIFIDPYDYLESDFEEIKGVGTDRIELYTEAYAKNFDNSKVDEILSVYKKATLQAIKKDLKVNAGHDLNLNNLNYFIKNIPQISEVSIGHALICDALYLGLKESVKKYLQAISTR